jgi:hypothetical protein
MSEKVKTDNQPGKLNIPCNIMTVLYDWYIRDQLNSDSIKENPLAFLQTKVKRRSVIQ